MARCNGCQRDVGCGCNLFSGLCAGCYSKVQAGEEVPLRRSTKRVVYDNPTPTQETNEFTQILRTKGFSREEKLRRINEILEKARQTYDNQLQNSNS